MSRRIGWALSVALLLLASLALPASAAAGISLSINGVDAALASPPLEQDGGVLVPARAFVNLVGGQVGWDAPSRTLGVTYGPLTAKVQADSATVVTSDGKTVQLSSPMRLIDGRSYLPLSFLTLVLGLGADWLQTSRQVAVRITDGHLSTAGGTLTEARIADAFLKMSPGEKARFLAAFPKGGDLHNHLSGAIFPEQYIAMSKNDPSLCLNLSSLHAIPCTQGGVHFGDLTFPVTDKVIDLWTMRNLDPKVEKPYDHFFATFSDFGQIAQDHTPDMVNTVAETAYQNNIQHLELMVTFDSTSDVQTLAEKLGSDWDPAKLEDNLQTAKNDPIMTGMIQAAKARLDQLDARRGCPDATKDYCKVSIRYIEQLKRNSFTNWQFFVEAVFGMELQAKDNRVVSMNPVQIEYGQSALDNYSAQMEMLNFLHSKYPAQHIALHAGELNPDVLKVAQNHDADLTFHIQMAVDTGAERIGHGADILWETNMTSTLAKMATAPVAVEINLTSNEYILSMGTHPGYNAYPHPIRAYLANRVPVVLSTDDAGVERTNLSTEYYRAATEYYVDYLGLKQISRNSLVYSFLPGKSLWVTPDYKLVSNCAGDTPGAANPSDTCKAFLAASAKAKLQWQLEANFSAFEAHEVTLLADQ